MPYVSIIMPAYNAEAFVESAINSVLAQTYTDYELIVINDSSTDSTAEIVSRIAATDKRILFFDNKVNLGVSATRNLGVLKASSDWIAFLDSDDMWRNDKLFKQIELIATHPDAVIVYSGSSFIDNNGKPYNWIMPAEPKMTYNMLLKRNLLSCSSIMVRKDAICKTGMANDKMHEDYSAWLKILKDVKYAYGLNEPLLIYRLSHNSKSSNRLKSAKMTYRSYRYVEYNPIMALILTVRYAFYSISKRQKIKRSF